MTRFSALWFYWLILNLVTQTLWVNSQAFAVDEFADVQVLERLPESEFDIRGAFNRSKSDACEKIGEGEPLELNSMANFLTNRDRRAKNAPLPALRQGFMSIGLELSASDESDLPILSRGQIVDYLNSNFVMLQARIRRDLLDRKLYYHHRPMAVTASYRGPKTTQAFDPLVGQTTNDIRSLGMFVGTSRKPSKAEHFRTIVMLYRNEMIPTASSRKIERYEWVFVRGVEVESEIPGTGRKPSTRLEPYVFVTEDNRRRLVHLAAYEAPRSVRQCDVVGSIAITGFDRTGLYPQSYATRGYSLRKKLSFDWERLEDFSQQALGGKAAEHLTELLDSILEGEIPPN